MTDEKKKINITLPLETLNRIENIRATLGTSRNAVICLLLAEALDEYEKKLKAK